MHILVILTHKHSVTISVGRQVGINELDTIFICETEVYKTNIDGIVLEINTEAEDGINWNQIDEQSITEKLIEDTKISDRSGTWN